MKRPALLVVCILVSAISVGVFASPQDTQGQGQPAKKTEVNVSGKWAMSLDMSMGSAAPALELKQDGAKITGTYAGRYGTFPLEGTLKDHAIQFSFIMGAEGQTVTMSFVGEVSADAQSMKGTASLGDMGEATWSAKRQ